MAKLAALATIFAVLLLVANNYAFRTTITTVEIDESSRGGEGSWKECQQKIQKCDLSECVQYITQSRNPESRSESLQQCCSQMNKLDDKCHCKALKMMVQEGQQQAGQTGTHQQSQMVDRAQTVVTYCRLPQRCEWQAVWF
ncbi:hypothetical protein LWI29_008457 [Acer saccharum]|uniref:Bifunctional inhibitor/plant lipid transfer protein/seed storage helical domain-containing protein n=1 Tax=Acer saccharum TaxID=4024 RepID=A0AA39SBY8_ACESA|nr:hypothetical protein LWI29_008457 [Acer saccharum]